MHRRGEWGSMKRPACRAWLTREHTRSAGTLSTRLLTVSFVLMPTWQTSSHPHTARAFAELPALQVFVRIAHLCGRVNAFVYKQCRAEVVVSHSLNLRPMRHPRHRPTASRFPVHCFTHRLHISVRCQESVFALVTLSSYTSGATRAVPLKDKKAQTCRTRERDCWQCGCHCRRRSSVLRLYTTRLQYAHSGRVQMLRVVRATANALWCTRPEHVSPEGKTSIGETGKPRSLTSPHARRPSRHIPPRLRRFGMLCKPFHIDRRCASTLTVFLLPYLQVTIVGHKECDAESRRGRLQPTQSWDAMHDTDSSVFHRHRVRDTASQPAARYHPSCSGRSQAVTRRSGHAAYIQAGHP